MAEREAARAARIKADEAAKLKREADRLAKEKADEEAAAREAAEREAARNSPRETLRTALSTPTSSEYLIQIGAFSSAERALVAWDQAKYRYVALQNLSSKISPIERDGMKLFRMQADAGSKSQAKLICRMLTDAGQPCMYVAAGL